MKIIIKKRINLMIQQNKTKMNNKMMIEFHVMYAIENLIKIEQKNIKGHVNKSQKKEKYLILKNKD